MSITEIKPAVALPILPEREEEYERFLNRGKPPHDYEAQLVRNHSDRIRAIFQKKVIPPYEVEIQPSANCNLSCIHCFSKVLTDGKLEDKIGEEEMRVIADRIDDFKENGFSIEIVKFCGTTGEPLVNPAMLPAVSLFKDMGKSVVVFTNGLYLERELDGKPYWQYLLDADKLVVSLDCATDKTFEALKRKYQNGNGRFGFRNIISGLQKVIENREDTPKVTVGFVISEHNYHEIVPAARLLQGIGVDELRFRVDFTSPEMIHKLAKTITKSLHYAEDLSTPNFQVVSIYSDDEIAEDDGAFNSYGRNCFNQYFWACVGPDAQLYSCGHRTYCGVQSFGDLLNNSFESL